MQVGLHLCGRCEQNTLDDVLAIFIAVHCCCCWRCLHLAACPCAFSAVCQWTETVRHAGESAVMVIVRGSWSHEHLAKGKTDHWQPLSVDRLVSMERCGNMQWDCASRRGMP
jgi:hypothetical protein